MTLHNNIRTSGDQDGSSGMRNGFEAGESVECSTRRMGEGVRGCARVSRTSLHDVGSVYHQINTAPVDWTRSVDKDAAGQARVLPRITMRQDRIEPRQYGNILL